ncbi:MAG: Bacterial alpha-L-rhamnosidase, partial [Armatimonadetes bacterium]|nr:Bacterial alpha-L-rhamnosidase [Armatimonadota bacterium]
MRASELASSLTLTLLFLTLGTATAGAGAPRSIPERGKAVQIAELRCEYLQDPVGLDEPAPRLSWRLESSARGQRQSAYRVLVASTKELLARDQGDLWDSSRVASDQTVAVVYRGKPLGSRAQCFWKVRAWDRDGKPSAWSMPASWTMALLRPNDWKAEWISYRDTAPLHTSRQELYLPPAHVYRTEFLADKPVRRATVYASALGLYELRLNGKRVGDALFTPGWSDYRRRAYYQSYDVTRQVARGDNAFGAVVTDGWYSGYLGYGLLVGYGPNKVGRYFYGKTPALLAQLEIEYADGTREIVSTGKDWKVTSEQPIREADMLMGETYDARMELPGWDRPGFPVKNWKPAILAGENGSIKAPYSDAAGPREVELGFIRPAKLEAYPTAPVRATQELKAVRMTEPKPGVYIFDLGQNFSGVARLRVKGSPGTQVTLRFGEMLHPDGRLMTENLRRARATDTYILRGAPRGEVWTPGFTYHGFQFVEVTGYPGKPTLDAITGVVMHSDTPLTSSFECSDPMANRLFQNVVWTQRANFFEVPTDCPQRDERLGWMGDAQIYVRAATYHADVASFFNKWLRDVEESQLPNGAYPDYAPYPMFHGKADGYGTAWTDAGIICPYTIYQVYNDPRIIERHWESMKRFMRFRTARSRDLVGVKAGNEWGDWLSLGEQTPIEYVDAAYFGHSADLMSRMARAIDQKQEASLYQSVFEGVRRRFQKDYLKPDGTLSVDTQTAYALALSFDLLPEAGRLKAADRLAE